MRQKAVQRRERKGMEGGKEKKKENGRETDGGEFGPGPGGGGKVHRALRGGLGPGSDHP